MFHNIQPKYITLGTGTVGIHIACKAIFFNILQSLTIGHKTSNKNRVTLGIYVMNFATPFLEKASTFYLTEKNLNLFITCISF